MFASTSQDGPHRGLTAPRPRHRAQPTGTGRCQPARSRSSTTSEPIYATGSTRPAIRTIYPRSA